MTKRVYTLLLLAAMVIPWMARGQEDSCPPLSVLPYYNDFEEEPCYQYSGTSRYDAFPLCWTRINDGVAQTYYPYISNENGAVINGRRSMVFSHSGYDNYAQNEYAVLPALDTSTGINIANLHLSFYARTSSYAAPAPMFIVGVMTTNDDTSTFVAVDTVRLTPTTALYSVSLATYMGTGRYIAIRCPRVPSTFNAFLDDVYLTDAWCEPPTHLSATPTHESITLHWGGNGGSYTAVLDGDTATGIVDTFYTFTGLADSMGYSYAVAAECMDATSPYLRGSVRTECHPLDYGDLPYIEDFERYGYGYGITDVSPCWHKGDSRPTVNYPYPARCSVYGDTVGLSMGSSPTSYNWAALTRVDNTVELADLELDFLIIRENPNYLSRVVVGVVTDILAFEEGDFETFTPVDTIDVSNVALYSIHSMSVRFDNYAGEGRYITLLAPMIGDSASATTTNSFLVDNVTLKVANPCLTPQEVSVSQVSHNTVTVQWDGTDTAGSYLVYVGTPGFAVDTATPMYTYINTQTGGGMAHHSATVTGLQSDSEYELVIVALCGSRLSDMSFPVRFHTLCTPLDVLPLTEDFEGGGGLANTMSAVNNLPQCWRYYNTGYPLYFNGSPYVYANQNYAHSGDNALYFNGMDQYAILPLTESSIYPISNLQVSFWARSATVNVSYVTVGVMSDPADTSSFVPIRTISTVVFQHVTVGFANYDGPHGHVALKTPVGCQLVIDDVVLEEIPNHCPPIADIRVQSTAAAARLTWDYSTEFGFPTSFEVRYRLVADTTTATIVTTVPEVLLTGLDDNSAYWVSVSANCGGQNGLAHDTVFNTIELPCISWDTLDLGVDTVTAGNPGTGVSNQFPVYANAPYSVVHHLFLASEIPLGGPRTLSGIAFDYAYNQPYQIGSCAIYLAHTASTSLANMTNLNPGGQLVFAGTMSFNAEGWNYIPFNQGDFEYDGTSNLIVTIMKSNGVSIPVTRPFRQENTPDRIMTAWGVRPNHNTSYSVGTTGRDMRSNTRFISWGQEISCTAWATCIPPLVDVDTSVSGTIRLLWVPGYQEESWNVDFRLANPGDTGSWVNVATETTATEHLFAIADLQQGAHYEFRVTANCSDAQLSSSVYVATPCIPLSIPFHFGFEGLPTGSNTVPADIHCWHHLNDGTMYNGYPIIAGTGHTGTRSLGFAASNGQYYGRYQAIVLPPVDASSDAINSLYLNFWARSSTITADPMLYVGVMTDPTDINTFQLIDSVYVDPTNHVWDRYEVSFENYDGDGLYIAIRANRPAEWYWSVYVDDITVGYEPMCRRVGNIRFRDVTKESATVYWTRGGNETTWEVTTGDSTYYVGDTVFHMNGLESDSVYTVSIRAICNDGDTSNYWSNSFHTPCYMLDTLPLINDFEHTPYYALHTTSYIEAFPSCWRRVNNIPANNNTNGRPYVRNTGTSGIHGNNTMYWELNYEHSYFVVLPPVEKSAYNISDLYLMFSARTLGSYETTGSFIIGVMDHDSDTAHFVPVDTITPSIDAALYTVSFVNYSGTGNYITIHGSQPHYGRELLLDDVVLTDKLCYPVSNLRASCTDTSVTLVWSPGEEVASGGTTDSVAENSVTYVAILGNDTVRGITDTFYTFRHLDNTTRYTYAVATECTRLNSVFQTGSIQTECPPLTWADIPYFEDFESYAYGYDTTISPCWRRGSVPSTISSWPYASHLFIGDDTVGLTMGVTSHYYRWAALPRLDSSIDITRLEVNFLMKCPGSGVLPFPSTRLIVGVAEDVTWYSGNLPATSIELSTPSQAYTYSGFVAVDSIDLSGEPPSSIHSVSVRFENYTGTGRYIVFYTPSPEYGMPNNSYDLDNINLRVAAPCPTPHHVRVTGTTSDHVFATWSGDSGTDQWMVYIGAPGFEMGSVQPHIVNDTVASFGGLTPNTDYEMIIVASCGGQEGYPSYPVQFHTQCAPIEILPFVEDFESVAGIPSYTTYSNTNTLPVCWLRYNASVGGEYSGAPLVHNDSTYAHSGNNAMRFHTANQADLCSDQYAIMPLTDSVLYPARGLQVSFWLRTAHFYYNSFIVVGVMSDPCDTGSFVAVDTVRIESLGSYSHHTVRMAGYRGPHGYITFKAPFQSPVNRPYIDDIVLEEMPCSPAFDLHVVNTGLDSLTLAWSDTSGASMFWNVEYDTVDFVPGDGTAAHRLVVNPYSEQQDPYHHLSTLTLTGLDSATVYHIYVYPDCFDSVVAAHLDATTLLSAPIVLPYGSDFENNDTDGWVLLNGDQHNYWTVGDATGNPGGSLHITDNGADNHYSGPASTVFAIRTLHLDTVGEYAYSFDWKCNGESAKDYLQAAILPAQTILAAGDHVGFDTLHTTLFSISLSQHTLWQSQSGTFVVDTVGDYLWVFMWHNDGSTYNQAPAAVDNVHIAYNSCPMPAHVVGTVSADSLYLSWDSVDEGITWEVSLLLPSGTLVATATVDAPHHVFDSLPLSSNYTVRIRTRCGPENTSLTYTAVYLNNRFMVDVMPNNPSYGSVSGGGMYYYGDLATLAALPFTGYLFTQWSDGDTLNPRSLTVTNDVSLTAVFEPRGIEEVESPQPSAPQLAIYPNPAKNATTVRVSGISGVVRVSVFDLRGCELVSETVICDDDCVKTFDLKDLAGGVYIVQASRLEGRGQESSPAGSGKVNDATIIKKLVVCP